jgi:hypothetical protein
LDSQDSHFLSSNSEEKYSFERGFAYLTIFVSSFDSKVILDEGKSMDLIIEDMENQVKDIVQ